MPEYYAITSHDGKWEYVTAGDDPDQVYREAERTIRGQEVAADDEEEISLEPETLQLLDNLVVVPREAAREVYHVTFTGEFED